MHRAFGRASRCRRREARSPSATGRGGCGERCVLRLAHTSQVVDVRRLELEVGDVGARHDLVLLVAEEDPGRVVDDQLLGLVVELFRSSWSVIAVAWTSRSSTSGLS